MQLELSEAETRVLACLIEKETTTPEYYPLSLNALTLACNQKNNRDPVVSYSEDIVRDALDSLREKKLARPSSAPGRVAKYEHSLQEVFNLGRREIALLTTLMLRGPQTAGELRDRSERMRPFSDLEEVESVLDNLMRWEPFPLAAKLPRQPGTKEPRYMHLLGGAVPTEVPAAKPSALRFSLEEEVATLRRELADLRAEFERFRAQFQS